MSLYKVTLGRCLWKRLFQTSFMLLYLIVYAVTGKDNRPQNLHRQRRIVTDNNKSFTSITNTSREENVRLALGTTL